MMGTRTGDLDPGVIVFLLERMSPEEIAHLVDRESGLLGVSGLTSDMKTLLASRDPRARVAVEMFCYQACKAAAALAAALGGLDALVFTGGIGEHAGEVRERICGGLSHLGPVRDHGHRRGHRRGHAHRRGGGHWRLARHPPTGIAAGTGTSRPVSRRRGMGPDSHRGPGGPVGSLSASEWSGGLDSSSIYASSTPSGSHRLPPLCSYGPGMPRDGRTRNLDQPAAGVKVSCKA